MSDTSEYYLQRILADFVDCEIDLPACMFEVLEDLAQDTDRSLTFLAATRALITHAGEQYVKERLLPRLEDRPDKIALFEALVEQMQEDKKEDSKTCSIRM